MIRETLGVQATHLVELLSRGTLRRYYTPITASRNTDPAYCYALGRAVEAASKVCSVRLSTLRFMSETLRLEN